VTGNEVDIGWPRDVRETDFSSGPLRFTPRGFLVAILPDPEEATRAVAALGAGGCAEREMRVYTGHGRRPARRTGRRRS
jgi:hypothetical protein